jgi:hypothetical protein
MLHIVTPFRRYLVQPLNQRKSQFIGAKNLIAPSLTGLCLPARLLIRRAANIVGAIDDLDVVLSGTYLFRNAYKILDKRPPVPFADKG